MGRKLVLTGTKLTDLTAPIIPAVDGIESAGSLYLIDFSHPVTPAPAGIANGLRIPNLFGSQLATLSGIPALDPTLMVGAGLNGSKGKLERSTKGGLHGIISQNVNLASGDGAGLVIPEALRQYLLANNAHRLYISAWDRLTRATPSVTDWVAAFAVSGSTTSAGVAAHAGGWAGGTLAKIDLGNAPGPRRAYLMMDTPNMPNILPADAAAGPQWGSPAGMLGSSGITLASRNLKWPSSIAYRFYIEDLTVSGRSYQAVAALDAELYTKEVLTTGGRYYGDTFTNPTTIP